MKMCINDSIKGKIRDLLDGRNVNITAVSELIGYNRSYLSRIRAGTKRPSWESMAKICSYFGIRLSQFFRDEFEGITPEELEKWLTKDDLRFLAEVASNEKKREAVRQLMEAFSEEAEPESE